MSNKEADRPPPIIQLGPVNQTLPVRTSATLPCQASGVHDAISWLKDGVPLSTLDNRRHVIDSDNTLSIKSEYYRISAKVLGFFFLLKVTEELRSQL